MFMLLILLGKFLVFNPVRRKTVVVGSVYLVKVSIVNAICNSESEDPFFWPKAK